PVTTADIASSGVSISTPIVSASVLQKRSIYNRCATNCAATSSVCAGIIIVTLRDIGVSTSARIFRTALMIAITLSISATAVSNWKVGFASGQAATVIDAPSCGNCCQISSVINGIYGCNIRNV